MTTIELLEQIRKDFVKEFDGDPQINRVCKVMINEYKLRSEALNLGVVSVSLPDIQDAAKQALERTKLPKNSPTTERELMLGERAFINGGIWVKNKYDGNER